MEVAGISIVGALFFSALTGYISVRYEKQLISRIAVFAAISNAGAFLTLAIGNTGSDGWLAGVVAAVVGHISVELITRKIVSPAKRDSPAHADDTNGLLQQILANENIKTETEITIRVK